MANPIPTKFCCVINTAKFSLRVVPNFPTNPKWRTVATLKKYKLLYLSNGSTNFYEILHSDAYWPFEPETLLKIEFLKIEDGGRPQFWKKKRFLCNSLTDFGEIW